MACFNRPTPTHCRRPGTAWRRRSDSGIDHGLRADDTGIDRAAIKHDPQEEPEPDKAPRFMLKMLLAVATRWQAPTTTDLLRRHADFPPEIRHTHKPVPMTCRIAALGEALTTRAGSFSDCMRVQGAAVMQLFANPVVGFRDMPLTTTEWCCKGQGRGPGETATRRAGPFHLSGRRQDDSGAA